MKSFFGPLLLLIFIFPFKGSNAQTINPGSSMNIPFERIDKGSAKPAPVENCDSVTAASITLVKKNLSCGKWSFQQKKDSGNAISQNQWRITTEPDTMNFQSAQYYSNTNTTGTLTFRKNGIYYIKYTYTTISPNETFQCTKTIIDSFRVDSINNVELNYTIVPPSCYGMMNGTITFNATGNYKPFLYKYESNPFDTLTHFEGVGAHLCLIDVKDSIGCIYYFRITIPNPVKIKAILDTKENLCYNEPGSIKVHPIAGKPPFYTKLNNGIFDTTFSYTSLPAGTYKLYLKDSTGCIDSMSLTLKNQPKILVNPMKGQSHSAMMATETYIIDDLANVKYKWTSTGGTILGEDSLYLAIVHWDTLGIGEVKVIVTNKFGCRDSASKSVVLNHVGMDELLHEYGLSIYPNPTKNNLNIQLQKLPEQSLIQLYSTKGNLVLQQELNLRQQLNLEWLPPGIYLLKIGAWSGQIVKE